MQYLIKCRSVGLLITIFFSPLVIAQNINTEKFQYLFPVPNSTLNSIETTIIIRLGEAFNNYGVENCLIVLGDKSGIHKGKITLAENNRTLTFKPYIPFTVGELITVKLNKGLKTTSDRIVPELQYTFQTEKINLNKTLKYNYEKYSELRNSGSNNNSYNLTNYKSRSNMGRKTYTIQFDSLPADFPEIIVDSLNNPAPGYIFLTPFSVNSANSRNYLVIADNYGVPIFYKRMLDWRAINFDIESTGELSYYNRTKYYLMDSSYNIIDSIYNWNTYATDEHECVILENHHTLLLGYNYQQVAMDTVVSGGDPNASVIGLIIEELAEKENVVFIWRSWDHFKITDATPDIDLTQPVVDYVHGNAIEIDTDGNILLSSRHLDEITKIDRQTGDIIWRWGGHYCKNNQFTFFNDSIGFSHQHHIRRLPNGNYTLFDNGNLHSPQFSRAVEYQLDQTNKTATLVREYRNNPVTYSVAMGSCQRLPNGNTLVGWGWFTETAITEFNAEGNIALSMSFADNVMANYRALKRDWKANLFVCDLDTLPFGLVQRGDSLTKSFSIINNSNQEIEINRILNRDSAFYVNTPLPITIPPYGTDTLGVSFKPESVKDYFDDLYIQWNRESERISQVVSLTGSVDFVPVGLPQHINPNRFSLSQNYPNPFNPSTKISFSIPNRGIVLLEIYDILGRKIKTLINEEMNQGNYTFEFNALERKTQLSSGIYLYVLKTNDYFCTKKMILLK